MTTSGTTSFNPPFSSLIHAAYSRCGIRRPQLLSEHIEDARNEANFLQVEFANRGPTLWTVDLVSVPLIPGIATYPVSPDTIQILDAYIRTSIGLATPTDRILTSVSRTEYASYPNKDQTGVPTTYWFNRQISPELTLWLVPDAATTYTLEYYRFKQVEDASIPSGLNVQLPYRYLDAFVAGLAARLAVIWAPDRVVTLAAQAEKAYQIASTQDVEDAQMFIVPSGLNQYFRP
ncbi:hypothetical protein [Chelatococcus sp.]|uniref:hypothetical protein n=1 Tax=Chelatococcus sp. TaxID=1953771 RepID=UPI001ECB70D3|nr:hypothetical protein [Chelatococcus sp.]MBX3547306.1 hypothetical protein [Chelatococcus sp.]CAH1677847.1 conserved hypothetical protein [Hyphomicrobiales bacterium]